MQKEITQSRLFLLIQAAAASQNTGFSARNEGQGLTRSAPRGKGLRCAGRVNEVLG